MINNNKLQRVIIFIKLLHIVYGRLSDNSCSCLCLATKVIIVFKNNKRYFYKNSYKVSEAATGRVL